ncbi:MAG: hypothetical protein AB9907_15350 [Flexilinea sp.]
MKHNKLHFFFQLVLIFVLSISITAVYAEGGDVYPSYTITDVIPGASVTISTRDFPADSEFVVSMKDMNSTGDFIDVVRFNTQTGGIFTVKVGIPSDLVSVSEIAMLISNGDGIQIPSSFSNGTPASVPYYGGYSGYGVYSGYPSFTIKDVVPGKGVVISAVNFPANLNFNITMGAYNPCGFGQFVESFNSGAGGSFEKTISIPQNLTAVTPISIRMDSMEGFYAYNWFGNIGAASAAVVTTEGATCDFSVFPSFFIKSVVKGESVTIETRDFPADSSFTVKMGYYVKGSRPSWGHSEPGFPGGFFSNQSFYGSLHGFPPMGGFDPFHPQHGYPDGKKNDLAFVGIEVGTYDTGDGAPQTLTYQIPADLKAYSPIVVWIEDQGACGFYAFNYFWNQNSGAAAPSADVPVVEVEPVAES